jgi:hypothetical protein
MQSAPRLELARVTPAQRGDACLSRGEACRGAPDGFTTFRAAADSRSAGEILAHLGDLIEWVDSQARGAERWNTSTPVAWDDDVARFHRALQRLDDYIASGAPLHHDATVSSRVASPTP